MKVIFLAFGIFALSSSILEASSHNEHGLGPSQEHQKKRNAMLKALQDLEAASLERIRKSALVSESALPKVKEQEKSPQPAAESFSDE